MNINRLLYNFVTITNMLEAFLTCSRFNAPRKQLNKF